MRTATYSPDDDKLRIMPAFRLPADEYARVKAAGYHWAPMQKVFFAVWSPEREALALEMCGGEIGDEDTSLCERAAERAERFEGYRDNRAADAERAAAAVESIAGGIPLGQPILIGHHSERHARRDAEKIQAGMARAVRMWDTAQYWKQRAAGALRHAKHKELPAVRARRIKALEADKRKQLRDLERQEKRIRIWSVQPMTPELAQYIAGQTNTTDYETYAGLRNGTITPEQAAETVIRQSSEYAENCRAWIAHIDNRLAYETAMLGESGGIAADRVKPEKGGGCKCWASRRGAWSYIVKVNRVSVTVLDNWGNGGTNFTRTIPFDKLSALLPAADVAQARDSGRLRETADGCGFVILDSPPDAPADDGNEGRRGIASRVEPPAIESMRETLRSGVQVFSAPQLFPTPPDLAARVVELAEIEPGHSILEPSAGTGNLIAALSLSDPHRVVAVEINQAVAEQLRRRFLPLDIRCADFLECNGDLGTFDRIIMNPPFGDGADIRHILHARGMLTEGGRLVAICANGPRQRAALEPIADSWINLDPGTFAVQGTNVNTAIVVIGKD